MPASRTIPLIALVSATFAGAAAAATPALVVDVDSGKILYADHATDPWFPASIAKLMTTYVALDMVRSGRASMDQLIKISPTAAAQPPSRMGFPPGAQLTLENALKIIMVKSANDIAAAIAENLGGSIEGFALLMNDAAARLGMRESRWVNPHGLPGDGQQTSARDMAILGRALLLEFPDHKGLFSIGAIRFGDQIVPNHNGLLGRYPGVDGMKTGFICPSGFNVVASASRGGRHLVTVVLGSPSARERTLLAADLFERGFSSLPEGDGVAPALSSGRGLEDLPSSNSDRAAGPAPGDLRRSTTSERRCRAGRRRRAQGQGRAGEPASCGGHRLRGRRRERGLEEAGAAAARTVAAGPRLAWARSSGRHDDGDGRARGGTHPQGGSAKPAARPEITRRASPSKRVARAP